ncbi:hypothetical protein PMSM_12170 [Paenibacillus macquariensis subsp. macquariensis]|uniref:Uncharacterized protein n=1 Tax=Paenibacillus macquariensis TaxID=948756 RepID=A0ABY1JUW0_9BACL|nr:hypothetical protein PMSM_12170 [Paenibacillus macquariensis subsp. macquariensis]SIQ81647.1 hypothetical protein SAMN05421578_104188 [Paenibacillus macquariensis]
MKKSPYEVGGKEVCWYKKTLVPSAAANAERLLKKKGGYEYPLKKLENPSFPIQRSYPFVMRDQGYHTIV